MLKSGGWCSNSTRSVCAGDCMWGALRSGSLVSDFLSSKKVFSLVWVHLALNPFIGSFNFREEGVGGGERDRERETETLICHSTHSWIRWFQHVPWPGSKPTTLVHLDEAPDNWATWQGPSHILILGYPCHPFSPFTLPSTQSEHLPLYSWIISVLHFYITWFFQLECWMELQGWLDFILLNMSPKNVQV